MYPEALDLLKYDLDFLPDGNLTLTGSKRESERGETTAQGSVTVI